jgi:hypothetical protein
MSVIDLFEDEIESIEYYGEEDTIDITVDDTHMFFANDIYTHNSGFDAEFVEAHQSGGSIKRIQKAHFFMSVAKTPEQKEAGLANIRIIKARFAADGQSFINCVFDNDTMQIRIEDSAYKNKIMSRGKKHHDAEDIDKLENKASKLNNVSSSIRIHEAVSKVNDESILSNLLESYTSQYTPENIDNKSEIIQIDETFSENNILPMNSININPEEEFNEMLQNIDEKTNDDPFEWNGESIEAPLEEKIIGKESDLDRFIEESKKIPLDAPFEPKAGFAERAIMKNIEVGEAEKELIDPDEIQIEHKSVHQMLMEARKSQGVIKKE